MVARRCPTGSRWTSVGQPTSPRDRIKTPSVGLQPNTKKPPNFPSEARTNLPNGRRQRKGSWEVRPELRSEGFLHCWFSFYSLVFFFLSFRFGENGKAWEKKGKKKKTKNENMKTKKKSHETHVKLSAPQGAHGMVGQSPLNVGDDGSLAIRQLSPTFKPSHGQLPPEGRQRTPTSRQRLVVFFGKLSTVSCASSLSLRDRWKTDAEGQSRSLRNERRSACWRTAVRQRPLPSHQ